MMERRIAIPAMALSIAVAVLTACQPQTTGPADDTNRFADVPQTVTVTSAAFAGNGEIPVRHTADGDDLSPPLTFANLPATTIELALVAEDLDAPTPEPFVHWVIYRIPAEAGRLPEGVPRTATVDNPAGALQGRNSFGNIGYDGPAPPEADASHQYRFMVYALDAALMLPANLTKNALLDAIADSVIAYGELVATYDR
jgi:Raf kinase inhibitor-like YbhB/YbcL family protein